MPLRARARVHGVAPHRLYSGVHGVIRSQPGLARAEKTQEDIRKRPTYETPLSEEPRPAKDGRPPPNCAAPPPTDPAPPPARAQPAVPPGTHRRRSPDRRTPSGADAQAQPSTSLTIQPKSHAPPPART